MQSWQDIIDSPVCAAIAVGLYVSVFYIMTNFTMLPPSSMLVLAGALIIPVTAVVCLVYATLSALGKDAYARQVAIFLCAVYLMILMRAPVFNIRGLAEAFQGFGEPARMAINCIYYIVPALLISFIFRNNVGKFALVMSAMTLAAFVGNFSVIGESLKDKDRDFGNDMAASLQDVTLGSTPNIYFIIADGYSSFAYMEENGIDVSGFGYIR